MLASGLVSLAAQTPRRAWRRALARLRVRRRGDALAVTIDKGGKDGAPASVTLPLGRARIDGVPVQPIAEISARLAPGIELPPQPHTGGPS